MNYRQLTATLSRLYDAREAQAIARLVMEERFGLTLTDLAMGRDDSLSVLERKDLEIIASQLAEGRPVQHILGHAPFCGRRFEVNADVLIPRPETEAIPRLVAQALRCQPRSILDIGTGSGCLAITLALAYPQARVAAIDLSTRALATARRNACRLGAANVAFLHHDALQTSALLHALAQLPLPHPAAAPASVAAPPVSPAPAPVAAPVSTPPVSPAVVFCAAVSRQPQQPQQSQQPQQPPPLFDVIVSNPPYVRRSEAAAMHANVLRHEPDMALFVPDDDPLLFYRAIAATAEAAITPTGIVVVEANAALTHATAELFESRGFATTVHTDCFGRSRFVTARRAHT